AGIASPASGCRRGRRIASCRHAQCGKRAEQPCPTLADPASRRAPICGSLAGPTAGNNRGPPVRPAAGGNPPRNRRNAMDAPRNPLPTPTRLLRLAILWLAGGDLRMTMLAVPPLLPLIHRDLGLSEKGIGLLSGLP